MPCGRGAPGDTYVSRPAVTGRGSTHSDTAFMGLTSSGGVTVRRKVPAGTALRPILFQPRHRPVREGVLAGVELRHERVLPGEDPDPLRA
ncbi:hypothetical protein GCM10009754_46070 [Amycolatopsis minnesotensis]|uniref:Uncharacterized protein n=1 Tax=Amycolatopsis minnesotensis TaxID=337894 RepID=A0ABP5CUQ2_9PSEU